MLTSRQRLLTILRHQIPDRYPWAPLLDGYFMQGLPPEQEAAGIPAFLRSIEADILLRHVPCWRVEYDGVGVTEAKTGRGTARAIETPLGKLTERSEHHPGAETAYVTEYYIKTPDDYAAAGYWLTHQRPTPDYAATQRVMDEAGEEGLVTVNAGSPPLTAFFRFLPQEQVSFEFYDHPERLDKLAEAAHAFTFAQAQVAAASPAEVVVAYAADITTRLVSPKMFERYALPFLQETARVLHAAGKVFVLHTCGDVAALLPMMRRSGIDAIDSLSEPPLGNTPFEAAMAELGDGVCLIGGVSPVVLANGTPDDVRAHVLDLFGRVPSPRNLLLCTSDATAYATPVENLRAVSQLVREYPLGC
ncbi:MAG: Methylcobalamin:coenzyme methyltransferase [Chloroflexota bacterium]|nr:Methylcobalamin:coenzyme methyltransferase [Chloroflexota bacterium]